MVHDPARDGPGCVEHHLAGIAAVAGSVGSGALTDSSHCGRIASQGLQNLRRCVPFGSEPCGLCHHFSVESREPSLHIASLPRQSQEFFSCLDCVQMCANSCPVPGISPRGREGRVFAGRCNWDRANARRQFRCSCSLQTSRGIGDAGKIAGQSRDAPEFLDQFGVMSTGTFSRDIFVSKRVCYKRSQGLGYRSRFASELLLNVAQLCRCVRKTCEYQMPCQMAPKSLEIGAVCVCSELEAILKDIRRALSKLHIEMGSQPMRLSRG